MWNWLINMLVKAPLPPPCCSCGEVRNKKLRQMQQAIEAEKLPEAFQGAEHNPTAHWHTECNIKISGDGKAEVSAES